MWFFDPTWASFFTKIGWKNSQWNAWKKNDYLNYVLWLTTEYPTTVGKEPEAEVSFFCRFFFWFLNCSFLFLLFLRDKVYHIGTPVTLIEEKNFNGNNYSPSPSRRAVLLILDSEIVFFFCFFSLIQIFFWFKFFFEVGRVCKYQEGAVCGFLQSGVILVSKLSRDIVFNNTDTTPCKVNFVFCATLTRPVGPASLRSLYAFQI